MLLLGNVFSFAIVIISIVTAHERDRKRLCRFMFITQVLSILAYLCVRRYTGIGTTVLNAFRTFLVSKKKYSKGFAAFYIILQLAFNSNFIHSVIDILPIVGGSINAVAYLYLSEDKELPFRVIATISSIFFWLPYYVLSGLVSAALVEIYLIVAKFNIIRKIFKERKLEVSKSVQMQ